ncbi:MAG: hypothetical protein L0207_01385 [Chlamydiae bacterium]|nr:hypothetical protein [Chlamydiota bacterium]
MEEFFNDLMFFERGIYTLWGSKPMTRVVLEHFTQEELENRILTEEEKKTAFSLAKDYTLPENWEKWKKISSRFPLKRYLLFQSDWYNDPKATYVYFVDILKTTLVIQENYDTFRNAIGFDFDPTQVVFEMQDKNSKIWEKIRGGGHALLWGILFGYGKKNSYAFHWKYFKEGINNFFPSIKNKFSEHPFRGLSNVRIDLNNFAIPSFISFEDQDEVVEKYKKERKRIRKIYKGKDFLDFTLEKITSE